MFDFPVKWGNQEHFTDPDGIVLTAYLSEKSYSGKKTRLAKM